MDDRIYEFWEPCPECNKAAEVLKKQRSIYQMIPYDAHFAAINPHVYNVDFSKKLDLIRRYIDNFNTLREVKNGLYFYSSIKGSGKTLIASVICNEVFSRYGINSLFLSETRLLEYLEKGQDGKYDKNGYDETPKQKIKKAKLLVIDDLGQKKTGRDYLNDVLFDILDHRLQKKLPTIFTSNYKIDETGLDHRIIDRIYALTVPVEIPAVDVREKQARDENREMMEALGYET